MSWVSPAQAIALSIDRTMNHPARSGQSFLKSFKALPHPPGRDAQPPAPTSAPAQVPTAYRLRESEVEIII